MGFGFLFLTALGLAMDAFAVSVGSAASARKVQIRHALLMGLFCGVFQFLMPLLGWLLGSSFSTYIEPVDHWIAFVLLGFIGGKMIWETGKRGDDKPAVSDESLFGWKRLTILAIATSIDALAVGISFAVLSVDIWLACTVIGLVAFCISFVGVLAGKRLGSVLGNKAALFGGLILVGIGIKILLEHLLS